MGGRARIELEQIAWFNRYWEDLYNEFPETRAQAVAEMGRAVKAELDSQIAQQGVDDAMGHVRSWQQLRLGSRGGYAAISPSASNPTDRRGRVHTSGGRAVTASKITRYLERGHAPRQPAAGSPRRWARAGKSKINHRTGKTYIPRYAFYSYTKLRATDRALDAAEKLLERISDQVLGELYEYKQHNVGD